MFKNIAAILTSALLGSACAAQNANGSNARIDADPALFRVADEDTTIYLFGTIHMLDEGRDWFDEAVKVAFDNSDELVIEALIPSDPAELGPVMALGLDLTGAPLRSEMPAAAAATLTEELSAKPGLSAQIDMMEPWLAALTLSTLAFEKLGFSQENGVETLLQAEATRQGKPVSGLGKFTDQIALFDSMPEDEQMDFLLTSIEELDQVESVVGRMIGSWTDGDMDALAGVMNEGFEEGGDLRERLLTNRNANWAEWIDARLDQPGTVFVAVGAGHLGGQDSVQDYLGARGIVTTRIEY
ncbi:MAG: TraB/GumN family protein [Pacificimonas sp.]